LDAQQAILKIGLRYQQDRLERARYEKERAGAAVDSTEIANRSPSQIMEQQPGTPTLTQALSQPSRM
jgi:hypothetical protein